VLLFGTKRESKKSWWKFGESSQSQLKLVVFLGERSGSFKNIQIAEQKQNITDMACDDTA